ncbi:MAG: hypothetical protein K2P17_00420 [Helicobacteraceae bacterium]|nr:hypothetical protein [Helicobacteraceae bacterium]
MKFNLKKRNKQKTANIVYYDSDTKVAYNSAGGSITQYTKKLDSKARISSTFSFDALLKANVEVPKTIDELDVDEFIVEQAYKQLNIPADSSYELSYFKLDVGFDADYWNYEVYTVDANQLEKTYDDLAIKTQYIDVITSVPFLPLVLYKMNKLDLISNHIFVFIGDNGGTFAFYSRGGPLYVKSLTLNVYKLRIEFNQETSLELNSVEFENFVAGNAQNLNEYRSSIDSMLNKISREIEENILYIKRVYQDLDPTALFFGMSIEYDDEFLSYLRDNLLIDTKPYNSLAFTETKKGNLAIADIAIYYADYYISFVDSKLPNFSYIKRPKPLSQRDSGQFIIIASGIFVLSLLYPAYNFGMSGFLSIRSDMLQKEYDNEIFPKAEEYRADEARLKTQIENLQNQHTSLNQQIASVRNDMKDIQNWQQGYISKSYYLEDILKVADESKVSVIKSTAVANDNHQLVIELNLFAKNQKEITDFIKKLSESDMNYKSVITEKVEKIGFDEKAQTSQTKDSETATNVTNQVAQTAQNVATSVNNALSESNVTKLQPIPATIDFNDKEALKPSVDGYLNSIVKVVVR